MKQVAFLVWLQKKLEGRRTAQFASMRLRSVLSCDRALVRCSATRVLAKELGAVLQSYFAVNDLCFRIAEGKKTGSMHYTLEADLTIS